MVVRLRAYVYRGECTWISERLCLYRVLQKKTNCAQFMQLWNEIVALKTHAHGSQTARPWAAHLHDRRPGCPPPLS